MNGITIRSSLFYLALSLLVLLFSYMAEKYNKKSIKNIVVLMLTFVAGFRAYSVGTDTIGYAKAFSESLYIGAVAKDPAFEVISEILLHIIDSPTFLFVAYGFAIYYLIITAFWRMRENISFTCAVFCFFALYFFQTMNGLRQFIAVAIAFYASKYLIEKRYVKYCLLVFIASLFHISALISLLSFIPEVLKWKDLKFKEKGFFLAMISVALLFSRRIILSLIIRGEAYYHYFRNPSLNIGLRLIALVAILVVSMLMHKNSKINCDNAELSLQNELLYQTRWYYCFSLMLGSVGYVFSYMERLAWPFALFQCTYFGMVIRETNRTKRFVMKAMVYITMLYVLYQYIFLLNGSSHHPYSFIWD